VHPLKLLSFFFHFGNVKKTRASFDLVTFLPENCHAANRSSKVKTKDGNQEMAMIELIKNYEITQMC